MGLFGFFRSPDINSGVEEFKNTEGAVLLDVRTAEEYSKGHIRESINVPLDKITAVENVIKDKNTPLYVHCLSGSRSGSAVSYLKRMGYTNVKNIGGIYSYRGKVVK